MRNKLAIAAILALLAVPLYGQTIRPTRVSQLRLTPLTTAQEGTMTLVEGDIWYNTDLNCTRLRLSASSVCILEAGGTSDAVIKTPTADQRIAGNFNLFAAKIHNSRFVDPSGEFTTIQAAIDDASTNSTVWVTSDQTLTAELAMRSGIRLKCISRGISISQGNSANLTNMINFSTNSADNASIEGCTIDGNRANNTSGNSLINLSTRTGNKVLHNIIQNAIASGVIMQAGTDATIAFNEFDAIHDTAVQIQPASSASTDSRVIGNRCTRWGAGCVKFTAADDNEAMLNHGEGTQLVAVVDTSTSTVTWVSGTQFSTLLSGMFANVDGTETQITSVDSATQITVLADLGSQSSVAMIAGSGDGMSINSGDNNLFGFNFISRSMSNCFVVTNSDGSGSSIRNRLIGNQANFCGDVGIWLVDNDGGALTVTSTLVADNMLTSNGVGGHTNFDAGAKISGTDVDNTAFSGNFCRDTTTLTQLVCLAMDTASTTNIVGPNYIYGSMTPFRSPLNANSPAFSGPFSVHGAFIANEEGSDLDSRIEGDTDVNLLYVDAGNDRVGIGTATPASLFDVDGDSTLPVVNPLEGTLSNTPRWILKVVDFSDMMAGQPADTFTLWTLPANTMIHDVMGEVVTGWSGGSISAAVCSVGTAAGSANDLTLDDDFFATGTRYELHDATASGGKGIRLFDATDKFAPYMFLAGGVIEIQCDLTGDDHIFATAGQARIQIFVSQPLGNTTTEAN